MDEKFHTEEERDGIRFSWNVWPTSRVEANRMVVPLACLYTPLKRAPHIPLIGPYEPVTCKGPCHSVLNPYCSVDLNGKLWICPFCYQRNAFPPMYASISETNLPVELIPSYTTIEYVLPRNPCPPAIFLFMIDTCMDDEELQAVKDSLLLSLTLLPEGAQVGLIVFGPTVQVFELGFGHCPKSYVFNGNKELTTKQIQQLLGLGPSNQSYGAPVTTQQPASAANQRRPPSSAVPAPQKRFIMPLSECERTLESILEELHRDPHPVKPEHRPLRSTGVAFAVAAGLLDSYVGQGARILAFLGGPCTQGPGLVVGDLLKEPIRAHHDLQKDSAKHTKKAMKYYSEIAKHVAANGHAVDIFACSVDQCGVMEMQDLCKKTCGLLVQTDTFTNAIFRDSFTRVFSRGNATSPNLNMAFNANIEVQTTRELKVCGAIGHCYSLNKKGSCVGETEIGIGGTSVWKMCSLDPSVSIGFYFEVVNQGDQQVASVQGKKGLIQFLTQYQNPVGQRILRVTTVCHSWVDTTEGLTTGFDQEAAAVLMGRIAIQKTETEETVDVMRWLDRMLIKLVNKFGEYRADDPQSLRFHPNFAIYPQFMFHLRRGPFLQVFNASPDETTFNRFMMNRENVGNSLTMMQPTLDAYTFSGKPKPVLLSAKSVVPDQILLLDTFFHVVIFYGATIAEWKAKGYQNDPQYVSLKMLLEAPKEDAKLLMKDRFPMPRFIECSQGGSQARFLLAVIDPSVTHTSINRAGGEVIFTEDVSLEVFMEHLKRLAVSP